MPIHIEAKKEDIADVVIMPGDPLRAKFIAENYLEDAKLVNKVRNMLGYTGFYKGKRVTVMGSGMGMPSMGIYSYELFKFYDVKKIIRVGSCGGYDKNLKLFDIILVENAYSESNFAYTVNSSNEKLISASKQLTDYIADTAIKTGIKVTRGTILSNDAFDAYIDMKSVLDRIPSNIHYLGSEMEAFALFHMANILGREAACLVTVSDLPGTSVKATPEERQTSLQTMIKLALESI
jgi:purine-nucleoside phosphorylase